MTTETPRSTSPIPPPDIPHSALATPHWDLLRAWWTLVLLSWRRQARSRQMVWIALVLMGFSVVWVIVLQARGRFGMEHWRHPPRYGATFRELTDRLEGISALTHGASGLPAYEAIRFGVARVIISPTVTNSDGQLVPMGGFQVFSQAIVFSLFLSFLLPMWSLSFATEAIGGDRETNSLIWILSRPLPRPAIYLAKFVALLPWAIGFNVGGFALLCLFGGSAGRLALSLYWPAVVWSTLAFAALFLLFGAWFRRPAVLAIVYSFCLEVFLGNMPGYLKRVSIGYYARCLMYEQAGTFGIQPDKPTVFLPVDGTTAVLILAGATIALLGLGMWIFSHQQYHEVD